MKKVLIFKRPLIQSVATILTNGYIIGFFQGKIYRGPLKNACVPGFNCYSCPGALGACPIGALQTVLGGRKFNFSFYVFGTLIFFGVLFGRLICGFICPFGFFQDLLHKIPTAKIKVIKAIDKPFRYLKYAVLLIMVILLPIFFTNQFGIAAPFFCKWLCPAGILEGGVPLVLANESLREAVGFLFAWKMSLLIIIILACVFIYRAFCKYLCPLGAFYALFNKLSFYRMKVDADKCICCGACEVVCGMGVEVTENINAPECIRCQRCRNVCPSGAIHAGFRPHPSAVRSEHKNRFCETKRIKDSRI